MKLPDLVYETLNALADTIWDWMYSWEEVRRYIREQAEKLRELDKKVYNLSNKKWKQQH